MFKFVVLLALVPAILATTGVSQCRSGDPMPAYINIDGCDETPCKIPLASTARMLVGFQAPRAIEAFNPKVAAGVVGLWIDYPLGNNVLPGCDSLNSGRCPFSEGEDAEYVFLFPLAENYPKISVTIELTLNDAEGVLNCVSVPITVVEKTTTETTTITATTL